MENAFGWQSPSGGREATGFMWERGWDTHIGCLQGTRAALDALGTLSKLILPTTLLRGYN